MEAATRGPRVTFTMGCHIEFTAAQIARLEEEEGEPPLGVLGRGGGWRDGGRGEGVTKTGFGQTHGGRAGGMLLCWAREAWLG